MPKPEATHHTVQSTLPAESCFALMLSGVGDLQDHRLADATSGRGHVFGPLVSWE